MISRSETERRRRQFINESIAAIRDMPVFEQGDVSSLESIAEAYNFLRAKALYLARVIEQQHQKFPLKSVYRVQTQRRMRHE